MSGPIRRLIGPTKSRLLQYVESVSGLLEKKPVETELDEEESKAEDFANRISSNITFLEKCNKDWSNILKELKGDAKVTEESEYTRVADREDAFIEVLLVATEVLARLKARITIISRKREQVAIQENLSTSTSMFQPSANLSASNMQSLMCLPKLQLPNFDGYILKWPEFWDIYESSVHRQM